MVIVLIPAALAINQSLVRRVRDLRARLEIQALEITNQLDHAGLVVVLNHRHSGHVTSALSNSVSRGTLDAHDEC